MANVETIEVINPDDPMDPADEVDFLIQTAGMLEGGEIVASYTLTLLAEASALGLQIMTGAGYDAHVVNQRDIMFFLKVLGQFQDNDAYDDTGATLPMVVTVVTNSIPPRKRQRTVAVKVKQR
jgi:hypothetical protein